MPILDFKELSAPGKGSPPGENLEALARELGQRMGLEPAWSGRGPDQGRDLVFTERRSGALGSGILRWLVSCKDFAKSGRSVSEYDAGSVTDKLLQHRAGAFLLVTTTTASTGLKAVLDGIDAAGTASTLVWDRHELERMLLQDENLDLVRRHLPLSYEDFVRLGSLPQALRALESFVPGRVYQAVAKAIDTYRAEETWITGELIWPHDRDSAATIDLAISTLLEVGDAAAAAKELLDGFVESDAFEATLRTLATFRPSQAGDLCIELIKAKQADGQSLSAYRFYVETFEPNPGEQIALAVELPVEDIRELFADETTAFINEALVSDMTSFQAWNDLDVLSSHTRVEEAYVSDLALAAGAEKISIEFQAAVVFSVVLSYDREGPDSSASFPGSLAGHIDAYGMYVTAVTVDTSSFYEGR